MKKVLNLVVTKEWFNMIVSGAKNEEYREIKPYWIKRLTTNCERGHEVWIEMKYGKFYIVHTLTSSSPQDIARIDQVLRKKLSISPSVCQRRVYAPING